MENSVCFNPTDVYSRGFVGRIGSFDYVFPLLLLQMIILFFLSRALLFLLRPLRQPKFVCNILAAVIIGRCFKPFESKLKLDREVAMLRIISAIGMMNFLFLLAVKMDLKMIFKTSGIKTYSIGIPSIALPLATTMGFIFALAKFNYEGHPLLENQDSSILLRASLLLSATAFPQVAHLLDEINLLTSELGQVAMSCAVMNDIIRVILIMAAVVFRASKSLLSGLLAVAYIALVIIVGLYVLRPIPRWIIKRTPEGKPVKEIYITAILVGAALVGLVGEESIQSYALGPMIFGLLIPDGPPLGATLVQKSQLMVSEILLPSLFILIGLDMDFRTIKERHVSGIVLGYLVCVCVAKLAGAFLPAAFIHKLSYRNAFLLGVIMNVRGIIEAGAFTAWKKDLEHSQSQATLILATTAMTAIATPLITYFNDPQGRLTNGPAKYRRSIQNTPSIGEFRILLCIKEENTVESLITLLEASNPTKDTPISAYAVHLVELVGRDAPILERYKKAGNIWKSTKSDQIMSAFTMYSNYTHGRVTIKPFNLVAPFKSTHEFISRLAEDNRIPLIIVPYHNNGGSVEDSQAAAAAGFASPLKNFINNLQDHAPCTVGILVNRGLNDHMRSTHFSLHIAVVFLGGADDREALAYGMRMSANPNVTVTLRRIILSDEGEAGYEFQKRLDRILDDSIIDEFKQKKAGNSCSVYHEETVDDISDAITIVRSLESSYNLVMVGKRRGLAHERLDKEMETWNENPELGVIGDVIVTSELLGGMVSVLAIHHFDRADD